jgi:hypothetical protein
MFIPDPDLDFLPIPDPGSSGQKVIGSLTIHVTMRFVLEEQERPVHSVPDNS